EPEFRILDGPRAGFAAELADRLDHAEEPARRARLSDGKLAAAGVEGKRAVVGEAVPAHELRAFALAAETEVLELHQRDHRIVVARTPKVQAPGAGPRLREKLVAVERPAGAHLHRVAGIRVVALYGCEQSYAGDFQRFRLFLGENEKTLRACARHDA